MRPGYERSGVRFAPPPSWQRLPPVTRWGLLVVAVSYVSGLFSSRLLELLVAEPLRVYPALELWRLLTYPLALSGIWNVLFGLLLLWSFGTELEPVRGSASYAALLLLSTLSAGVVGSFLAHLLRAAGGSLAFGSGLSAPLTAVIVAWALLGPAQPVRFFGLLPMTRRLFAGLALVLVVFGELDASRMLPGAATLARLGFVVGGLPVAWAWARSRGGPFRPWRAFRRRRLRVIREESFPTFH